MRISVTQSWCLIFNFTESVTETAHNFVFFFADIPAPQRIDSKSTMETDQDTFQQSQTPFKKRHIKTNISFPKQNTYIPTLLWLCTSS